MSSRSERRSFPIVLAAPSGSGKTTIARALVSRYAEFVFSVSATTRAPRPGERHGVDYDFVNREAFEAMVASGGLAEWAEVHGNLYGTPGERLRALAEEGKRPILDIDVQGARQVRRSFPEAVLIFVLPPTAEELCRRLVGRGTEGSGEMEKRLRTAREELDGAAEFDYVIVNDDLDHAIASVRMIAEAEAHAIARRPGFGEEIARLRREIDEYLRREGAQPGAEG